MTDEISGVEGPETTQTEDAVPARDYETEARKMGWVPEAEFTAKKPGRLAKSAQKFVEDTDSISPHVKRIIDAEVGERVGRLEKVQQNTIRMMERQFQEDLTNIRTAQKAAAKDGDDAEFDRLEEQKSNLIKQGPDAAATTEEPPALVEFKAKNPWYESDVELAEIAEAYSQKLNRDNPRLPFPDNLKKTEAKIRSMFPEKFETKKPNGHANVDGGGENPGGGNKADPLAKLSSIERSKAKEDMAKYPKIYTSAAVWLAAYSS